MNTIRTAVQWVLNSIEAAIVEANVMGMEFPVDMIDAFENNHVRIYTHLSRDISRMRNGGEYNFWTEIWEEDNQLHISEEWSAEFDPRAWLGDIEVYPMTYAELQKVILHEAVVKLPEVSK